jgi:Putative addiction module component
VPNSYKYRFLKGATWGIALDLKATASPLPDGPPPQAERVADGLYLQIDLGRPLTEEEVGFLRLGLRLVAAEIALLQTAPILVRIVGLEYNPCDYQPEGLAPAIAGWAAREFGFPESEIPVDFELPTEAQRRELERRLTASLAAPDEGIPWEEVLAKALARA